LMLRIAGAGGVAGCCELVIALIALVRFN
jgi:hypothetical protein